MNIEPTLALNEFKVTDWNATFLFAAPQKLSVEDAKVLIEQEMKKQFDIFIAQKISNKHHTIALFQEGQ
ncbi:MAG TPA: hypothetical protein VGM66_00680 [Candidatus Udaeobacter sp.]|jgi:hypothetical protein